MILIVILIAHLTQQVVLDKVSYEYCREAMNTVGGGMLKVCLGCAWYVQDGHGLL